MFSILKIFVFTILLLPDKSLNRYYIYHYQYCHFTWAEDFTYQLELKNNQVFYFTRRVINSRDRQTNNDCMSCNYYFSTDTLVLKPSIITNKFVQQKGQISYLLKDNKLTLIDKLKARLLPPTFEKSNKPIFFKIRN